MSGEYVLLWSQRRNMLHIDTLSNMLAGAMRDYRDNRPGDDDKPLVIGTRDLCQRTADNIAPTLAKREPGRGLRLVHGGAA